MVHRCQPRPYAWTMRVSLCGSLDTVPMSARAGTCFAAAAAWELWRQRSSYDVVYFLMTGAHVVSCSLMAKLLGKPILMKFSGSNTIQPPRQSLIGRVQLRLLSHWASRIMVLNDAMRAEGRECGLDSQSSCGCRIRST